MTEELKAWIFVLVVILVIILNTIISKPKQETNPKEVADKGKLRGKANELRRKGAAWVVIVYKDYSDSWIHDGRYLPLGHDGEVQPKSYCILGDSHETWDALPGKLKGLDLDELNRKCRFVYVDSDAQLVRDGWGNWRFVRRDGKLLLVWQLTGYGEKERRERDDFIDDLIHRAY